MSKVETLDQLLIHEVADLLSAEEQLIEALPKLAQAASAKELKKALINHIKETQSQYTRLQETALALGMQAEQKTICTAMKGLIAEGQTCVQEIPAGPVRDAAIIGSCQRVEHYEMAAYRGACSFADELGLRDILALLKQTLQEEIAADQLLTEISKDNTPRALTAK
jgi:ferritin-like metal-binding protein YciE